MKNIEVEVRSLITEKEYKNLLKKLNKEAKLTDSTREETVYFNAPKDLRIRRDNKSSYIILKEGKINNKWRREFEVKYAQRDFKKAIKLFQKLGHKIEIRWFRKRHIYKLNDIKVLLDNTRGYGYIIELEQIVSSL